MGKKQKETMLGRSLMKDRRAGKRNKSNNSLRHTSEVPDGQDYNRIDFKSITEETDVDSFLSTAELAGTDFKAQKLNIKFVRPSSMHGILTSEERSKIKLIQDSNKSFLRIPRRPPWDRSMSTEELVEAERTSFLEWRRSLSSLQEKEGIVMTPFEKNLAFWRQLWRVIERSDVVVQIVDARNPLLFRCDDLSCYTKEVDIHKENLLLVNKADFLTEEQRQTWAEYFEKVGIKAVFFSATLENPLEDEEDSEEGNAVGERDLEGLQIVDEEATHIDEIGHDSPSNHERGEDSDQYSVPSPTPPDAGGGSGINTSVVGSPRNNPVYSNFVNTSKLLTRQELIEVFKNFHQGPKLNYKHVTIGLVGYPNVGKSSTINSLCQEKKTAVSATPGKTKHFQTLFLSDDILLCDCPGLVFPAFVMTKEEMLLSGILPIDQMRDHVPPMNHLLSLIPRHVFEATYGLRIPLPLEGEDPDRSPTSEEFLSVYGYMRGFMSSKGRPDHPRSSRLVLKDYVKGKILFCHAPPNVLQEEYHKFSTEKIRKIPLQSTPQLLASLPEKKSSAVIDALFFNQNSSQIHYKGKPSMRPTSYDDSETCSVDGESVHKPWRTMAKIKRNSRQKARVKFAHLDN